MHILADADVSKLIQTLQQRIPQEVLAAVARAGPDGLTQGAVVRAVNRLFPSTVDQDALREQALASLAWFRYHGDVHAGAYRYRIMPPYAVALDTASAQTAQITVQLCGDPRRDVDLTEQLATLGLALSTVTVDRDRRGPQGLVPVAVGWRRHVTLAPAQLPDVRACCERCQQPVISAAELGQRLPTIDGLLVPPQSACNVPPPWAGEWAAYAPSLPDGNRWQAIDSWRAGAQRVLRWCSDDAEDRRPVYRYFYHRGKELLNSASPARRCGHLGWTTKPVVPAACGWTAQSFGCPPISPTHTASGSNFRPSVCVGGWIPLPPSWRCRPCRLPNASPPRWVYI